MFQSSVDWYVLARRGGLLRTCEPGWDTVARQSLQETRDSGMVLRVTAALPPGEKLDFVTRGMTTPSKWVTFGIFPGILLGIVPGVVLFCIHAKSTKHYYFALTGTAAYVLKLLNPRKVVAVYPLGSVPISSIEPGKRSTVVYLLLPNRRKPARLVLPKLDKSALDRLTAISMPAAPTSQAASAQTMSTS